MGTVSLVLDLRIAHERWSADIDRTLNEDAVDKVLQYRADYNNRPSHTIAFMSAINLNIDGAPGDL